MFRIFLAVFACVQTWELRSAMRSSTRSLEFRGRCPRGTFCSETSLRWKTVGFCTGRCVPCGQELNGTENGLDCEACSLDVALGGPSCTTCKQELGEASAPMVLLQDLAGRARCYKRPDVLNVDMPGDLPRLCAGATQGVGKGQGLQPVSLGELWKVWDASKRTFVRVPVRLQPLVHEASCTEGPCPIYLAVFDEASSIKDEARTAWAGAAMLAKDEFVFTVTPQDSIAGRSLGEVNPYNYEYYRCNNCIWRLEDVDPSDNGPVTEFTLKFVKSTKNFLDEVVARPPLFRLSPEAVIALGVCLDFIQTGSKPTASSEEVSSKRASELIKVAEAWKYKRLERHSLKMRAYAMSRI